MKDNFGDRLRATISRLRSVLRLSRKAQDADVDDEFTFHVEMETQKYVASGMSPVDARREALRAFGGSDRHKESMRDGRGFMVLSSLSQDLRYAFRTARRGPLYAIVVVLTIGMGVALNSSLFSIFDGYVFRPLPFDGSDRIVVPARTDATIQMAHEIDALDYMDIHNERSIFSKSAAFFMESASFSDEGSAERVSTIEATGEYFDVYNVRPILGRAFADGDDRAGAPRVVVLSYDYWKRRFNADRRAIGRVIRINGSQTTIVGVMPRVFALANSLVRIDAFTPVRGLEQEAHQRGNMSANVVARLADGITIDQAKAAARSIARRQASQFPATNAKASIVIVPETKSRPIVGIATQTRQIALAFLMLAALVLGIACVNVTNMTLARSVSRQREFALRASIGASQWRIARQLITEMAGLCACGGVLGLILGMFISRKLSSVHLATDVPIRLDFAATPRVLIFTAAVTLFALVVTALVPTMHAAGRRLNDSLRSARGDVGEPRARLRSILVVVQLAASVVVLAASALFLKSAQNAQRVDLGFRTDHILLAAVDADLVGADSRHTNVFYRDFVARVRALPGVRSVATARRIPLGYSNSIMDVMAEGVETKSGQDRPTVFYNNVSPEYFNTLGMPLVAGRTFQGGDTAGAPSVAIVSAAMAEQFWPNDANVVGKRFRSSDDTAAITVVGIVKNAKYFTVGEPPRSFAYMPIMQNAGADRILHIWTSNDPHGLVPQVRAIAHELDAAMPIYDVWTMDEHLGNGRAFYFLRLAARITAALAILALFLCSVGLYGVVAYSVARRTREIGVRMAFGANRSSLLRLLLTRSLASSIIGLVIGVAMAVGALRLLGSMLIGVSASNPAVMLGVAGVLMVISTVATLLPALRALYIQPTAALRAD